MRSPGSHKTPIAVDARLDGGDLLVGIIASGSPAVFTGPRTKYEMMAKSLRKTGSTVILSIPDQGGWEGARQAARLAGRREVDVLIVRAGPALVAAWPRLLLGRMRGQLVVVEVPTPASSGVRELMLSGMPWHRRLRASALIGVTYPWLVMVGTRVIQFGSESRYFSLGLKRKTLLADNAIDVEQFREARHRTTGPLRLLMVGAVADWHGIDRVIRGMGLNDKVSQETTLRVVGDGPAVSGLRSLAVSLKVDHRVEFLPTTQGAALDVLCDDFDAGLGSLALHRAGLTTSSSLKNREYMARAMPVVYAGQDPGLAKAREMKLALQVPEDDKPLDLSAVWKWVSLLRTQPDRVAVRSYAESNLGMQKMLRTYLG